MLKLRSNKAGLFSNYEKEPEKLFIHNEPESPIKAWDNFQKQSPYLDIFPPLNPTVGG